MAYDGSSWIFLIIAVLLVFSIWLLEYLCSNNKTSNSDEEAQSTPIVSSPSNYLEREDPVARSSTPSSSYASRLSCSRIPTESGFGIDTNTLPYPPYSDSTVPYPQETPGNSTVPTAPYPLAETMPQPAGSGHSVSLDTFPDTWAQATTTSVPATAPYPLPNDTLRSPSSTTNYLPPSYTEAVYNR